MLPQVWKCGTENYHFDRAERSVACWPACRCVDEHVQHIPKYTNVCICPVELYTYQDLFSDGHMTYT